MEGFEQQELTPIVPLIVVRVQSPAADVDQFIADNYRYFGADVIFLATDAVHPPGRRVRFSFELADGRVVVCGEGIVLRSRRDTGNPTRPPGMELRYGALSEGSQAI